MSTCEGEGRMVQWLSPLACIRDSNEGLTFHITTGLCLALFASSLGALFHKLPEHVSLSHSILLQGIQPKTANKGLSVYLFVFRSSCKLFTRIH